MQRSTQILAASRTRVDEALLRHRADPTDENLQALMAEMQRHNSVFMEQQTIEYIERTKR